MPRKSEAKPNPSPANGAASPELDPYRPLMSADGVLDEEYLEERLERAHRAATRLQIETGIPPLPPDPPLPPLTEEEEAVIAETRRRLDEMLAKQPLFPSGYGVKVIREMRGEPGPWPGGEK